MNALKMAGIALDRRRAAGLQWQERLSSALVPAVGPGRQLHHGVPWPRHAERHRTGQVGWLRAAVLTSAYSVSFGAVLPLAVTPWAPAQSLMPWGRRIRECPRPRRRPGSCSAGRDLP